MKIQQSKNVFLVCTLLLTFLAYSTVVGVNKSACADLAESSLPFAVQQSKSMELFHEIFQISQEDDKFANIDRITDLYWQIIKECPDAPLAQESHWHLIETYLTYFQPPQVDEALLLFKQFKSRYPDSPLMNVLQDTMAKGLYANRFWNDLHELEASMVAKFFATGKPQSPMPIFYYSEASFHLNEIDEAIKGYQALLDFFP